MSRPGWFSELSKSIAGQFLRFVSVGGAGFVIDFAVTLLLLRAGWPPWAARLVAIAVAMLITWSLNRGFTFGACAPLRSLLPYTAVTALAAGVNYVLFLLLLSRGLDALSSLVLATVVSMIVSFLGYRRFAFGANRDQAQAARTG